MPEDKLRPLGVVSRDIWIWNRIVEVGDAMKRYTDANLPIPIEWVKEYNWLLDIYKKQV